MPEGVIRTGYLPFRPPTLVSTTVVTNDFSVVLPFRQAGNRFRARGEEHQSTAPIQRESKKYPSSMADVAIPLASEDPTSLSGVALGKGAWDCDKNCEIPPELEVCRLRHFCYFCMIIKHLLAANKFQHL